MAGEAIEGLLEEDRTFAPPDPSQVRTGIVDQSLHEEAERDPEAFWAERARELTWMRPFTTTLEWQAPFARWFEDGTLNASVNCIDRHVDAGQKRRCRFGGGGQKAQQRCDSGGGREPS